MESKAFLVCDLLFDSSANLQTTTTHCTLEIRWNFTGSFIGCASGISPAPDSGTVDNRSLLFDYFLATPLLDINNTTEERKFSGNEDAGHNTDPLGRVIDAYVHHALVDSLGDMLFADVQGLFILSRHIFIVLIFLSITPGVIFEDGSLCLFDPQAHTCVPFMNTNEVHDLLMLYEISCTGGSGHWDKGVTQITMYREQHKCNSICRSLHLDKDDQGGSADLAKVSNHTHPLRLGF